jgi:hypothetical protein
LLTWINEGHTGLEQLIVVHCHSLVECYIKSRKDIKSEAIRGDYDEAKLLPWLIASFSSEVINCSTTITGPSCTFETTTLETLRTIAKDKDESLRFQAFNM